MLTRDARCPFGAPAAECHRPLQRREQRAGAMRGVQRGEFGQVGGSPVVA